MTGYRKKQEYAISNDNRKEEATEVIVSLSDTYTF